MMPITRCHCQRSVLLSSTPATLFRLHQRTHRRKLRLCRRLATHQTQRERRNISAEGPRRVANRMARLTTKLAKSCCFLSAAPAAAFAAWWPAETHHWSMHAWLPERTFQRVAEFFRASRQRCVLRDGVEVQSCLKLARRVSIRSSPVARAAPGLGRSSGRR